MIIYLKKLFVLIIKNKIEFFIHKLYFIYEKIGYLDHL